MPAIQGKLIYCGYLKEFDISQLVFSASHRGKLRSIIWHGKQAKEKSSKTERDTSLTHCQSATK